MTVGKKKTKKLLISNIIIYFLRLIPAFARKKRKQFKVNAVNLPPPEMISCKANIISTYKRSMKRKIILLFY